MPRKGWSQVDTPSGWVQIIRGPRRPLSTTHEARRATEKVRHEGRVHKASRQPRAAVALAVDTAAEVERFESAIAVSGEANPHARPLKDALQATKSRSKVPPVAERVEACKKFLERAKRRVARRQRVINMEEVEEAEKRMLVLQAEAAHPPELVARGRGVAEADCGVDQGTGFFVTVSQHRSPQGSAGRMVLNDIPDLTNVPPMPTNPQDLEGWISNRNCELRNALEFGDVFSITKIGTLLSQGAASLASMNRDVKPMRSADVWMRARH